MSASVMLELDQNGIESAKEACRVMVIYEDVEAGRRAMEIHQRINTKIEGAPAFDLNLWRINCLASPAFAHLAEDAAAEADIVLISICREDIPRELSEWLNNWAKHRTKAEAMLVLVTAGPAHHLSPVDASVLELENVARRHGLDFLYPAKFSRVESPLATHSLEQPKGESQMARASFGDVLSELV